MLCGVSTVILQSSIFPQFPLVPDILLILCVYIGIYYRSFGGAASVFFLGYVLDSCSGTPVGTHAFAMSVVFAAVAAVSPFLWLNNPLSVLSLVMLAVFLKTGIFFFLSGAGQLTAWFQPVLARYIMWDVAVALVLTPLIFGLLYRKRQTSGRRTQT